MNFQLSLQKSESIKFIQTETIYEQPFFTPNIDSLSLSENLYQQKISNQQAQRSNSPKKWVEGPKKISPRKMATDNQDIIKKNEKIAEIQKQATQQKALDNENKVKATMQERYLMTKAKILFHQQRSLCMKKYFKIITLAIVAVLRMKRIAKTSLWKKYNTQYNNIAFYVKLELIQTVRINEWCKAVCAKSLTSVTEQLHDFVMYPNNKQLVDISIMKTMNACKFLLENLTFFSSQPKYFSLELKNFLFTQIFLKHKCYFTKFVSSRTLYLNTNNRKIKTEELTMILIESILVNSIIPNILESNQSCLFLIKTIISLLQILFTKTFRIIPIAKRSNIVNISTFQIALVESKYAIEKKPQTEENNENLIQGLFDETQLSSLLKYKKGFGKQMKLQFQKFACNLYVTVLE